MDHFLDSRAEIHQILALFFLENLRHQKVILKLTDLYLVKVKKKEEKDCSSFALHAFACFNKHNFQKSKSIQNMRNPKFYFTSQSFEWGKIKHCNSTLVLSRFFDPAGHETMYASCGNKYFSLNLVIVRLTKIMNRADKNWEQFQKIKYLKNQNCQKHFLIKVGLLVEYS